MRQNDIVIGIDTGGTYTDAVLLARGSGKVLEWSKVRTDKQNLGSCIREAVIKLIEKNSAARNASAVNLSTTLATNAIAEGRMRPVCLVLAGYDEDSFKTWSFEKEIPSGNIIFVRGGHDRWGDESSPLDEEEIRRTAARWKDRVEAFAVSALFGNRNPDHEIRARWILQSGSGLPCTCGHELTGKLNALSRASTAAMNASLVPIVREWMDSVGSALSSLGVDAPLHVVRGDGSLVSSTWAKERPIETILSGPAASAIGASRLAGLSRERDAVVIDMGGTTTDIVLVRKGSLKLREDGAMVGGFRAMIPSGEINTTALGGDSQVFLNPDGVISIGPLRVEPLCIISKKRPEVIEHISRITHKGGASYEDLVFLIPAGKAEIQGDRAEKRIIERSGNSLLSLEDASKEFKDPVSGLGTVMGLVRSGKLEISAFTPTDAMCAMGCIPSGDVETAVKSAEILASLGPFEEGNAFCRAVLERVSEYLSLFVVESLLERRGFHGSKTSEENFRKRLAEEIVRPPSSDDLLPIGASLNTLIIGVGAPCDAFIPKAAGLLKAEFSVPDHAPVANAAGAAAAAFSVRKGVLVLPLPECGGFRVHLPWGTSDMPSIEEAIGYAETSMKKWLGGIVAEEAEGKVSWKLSRENNTVKLKDGTSYLLGITLWFEAVQDR